MDENLSAAVKEAFVRLHKEGLIYRCGRMKGGGAATGLALARH